MKVLLDTHAFVWMHAAPERLSPGARTAILEPANSVHLSIAAVWEMQIKSQLGKLTFRAPLAGILSEECAKNRVVIEAIEIADVVALGELPHHHRDPFDRLMVAQARRRDFHLVTHDPEIARYDVPTLW